MKFNREFKNKILSFFKFIPDEQYLKIIYYLKVKKRLNLKKPETYNEKLQWLKLHDRNPIYEKMVDKYEVKSYVANIIGKQHLIPTLGVYDKFENIDFDKLPNQFVIKCTHDSGGLIIVKDKLNFDYKKAERKINNSLKSNFYYVGREWPYKNVRPRIIVEKFMEDDDSGFLTDYKFFCFHGEPKLLYISKDKSINPTTDFFDMKFNHLDIKMRDPNSTIIPSKPKNFENMKKLAKVLSNGFPHVRVDFYEINGKIYFGEFTFYHNGGFSEVKPTKWNLKLGSYINLNRSEKDE